MNDARPLADLTLVEAALRCAPASVRGLFASTLSPAPGTGAPSPTAAAALGTLDTAHLSLPPSLPRRPRVLHAKPPRQGGDDGRDPRALGEGRHRAGVRPRRAERGSPVATGEGRARRSGGTRQGAAPGQRRLARIARRHPPLPGAHRELGHRPLVGHRRQVRRGTLDAQGVLRRLCPSRRGRGEA